jgi:hypothetical protein
MLVWISDLRVDLSLHGWQRLAYDDSTLILNRKQHFHIEGFPDSHLFALQVPKNSLVSH